MWSLKTTYIRTYVRHVRQFLVLFLNVAGTLGSVDHTTSSIVVIAVLSTAVHHDPAGKEAAKTESNPPLEKLVLLCGSLLLLLFWRPIMNGRPAPRKASLFTHSPGYHAWLDRRLNVDWVAR